MDKPPLTWGAYDDTLARNAIATIDPDVLARVTINLAEELDFVETDQQALGEWALGMQARLQTPPSLRPVLRNWVERVRVKRE